MVVDLLPLPAISRVRGSHDSARREVSKVHDVLARSQRTSLRDRVPHPQVLEEVVAAAERTVRDQLEHLA